jgi:hypothetical protein
VKSYATTQTLEILLLLEMVQRVIKNYIRERLRKAAKELRVPLEGKLYRTSYDILVEPYRRIVADVLNLVFANDSKESDTFWKVVIKQRLLQQYPGSLTEEQEEER